MQLSSAINSAAHREVTSDHTEEAAPLGPLSLPKPCLKAISSHLCTDLCGVRTLISLVRTSRSTYDAYAPVVCEAIDPGCVEELERLLQQRAVMVAEFRTVADGLEGRGGGHCYDVPGSGGTPGSCSPAGDGASSGAAYSANGDNIDGDAGSVTSATHYWQRIRCTAAEQLLAHVPHAPSRKCAVRPGIQAMWAAHRPGQTISREAALKLGLQPQDLDALPCRSSGRYLAATAHRRAVEIKGPGSHVRALCVMNAGLLIEARARAIHYSVGDPSAGPWLLSLPSPCMDLVIHHLQGTHLNLPKVQTLLSLLRASSSAYDAYAPVVYEAIDPGCVDELQRLLQERAAKVDEIQRVADGQEDSGGSGDSGHRCTTGGSRVQSAARDEASSGAPSSSTCSSSARGCSIAHHSPVEDQGSGKTSFCSVDVAAASSKIGCRGAGAHYWQGVRRTAAAQVLVSLPHVPTRKCAVRPGVQAMWHAHTPGQTLDAVAAARRGMKPQHIQALLRSQASYAHTNRLFVVAAAKRQAVQRDGPGSHAEAISIRDSQAMIEERAWAMHCSDGDPTAGPWLLSLPSACMEVACVHCVALGWPGVKGIVSVLRSSRTAFVAFGTPAYDAIDPGCVAELAGLIEDRRFKLEAVRRLAEGKEECVEAQQQQLRGGTSQGESSGSGSSRGGDAGAAPSNWLAMIDPTSEEALAWVWTGSDTLLPADLFGRANFEGKEARQFRHTEAVEVMRRPPIIPSMFTCPVRPRMKGLKKSMRPQTDGQARRLSRQDCYALGLTDDNISTLPELQSAPPAGPRRYSCATCYDSVAAHTKAIELLGLGSLSEDLPDAAAIVEERAREAAKAAAKKDGNHDFLVFF